MVLHLVTLAAPQVRCENSWHWNTPVLPKGSHSDNQTTIGNFSQFVRRIRKPANKHWYETLTKKTTMCVRDLRPLNIVKDQGLPFQGFVDFCEAQNSNYQLGLPCPAEFENCKSQLQIQLQSIPFVALTTDMWTRVATEG